MNTLSSFLPRQPGFDARCGMRVLHLSKEDSGGGAAEGFIRIHRALLAEGCQSVAYVMRSRRREPYVIDASRLLGFGAASAWRLGRLAAKAGRLGRRVEGVYDFDAEAGFPAKQIIRDAQARADRWDFVVGHWTGGFLTPRAVVAIASAIGARIALWQVDMAHVTGGCHSAQGCRRFTTGCGVCPLLYSANPDDVSRRQSIARRTAWEKVRPLILAQSRWSADQAAESHVLSGFQSVLLPIPPDFAIFNEKIDQAQARAELGLPSAKRILLVRALDPSISYKGFGIFQQAMKRLEMQGVPLHVVSFGQSGLLPASAGNVTYTELGPLRGDPALARAYRSADFFVSPAINETGPMTIAESLACGRPCVAFPVGIAPDLLVDGENGRLASPSGDVEALADAMREYAMMPMEELMRQGRAAARRAADVLSPARLADGLRRALA